MGEDDEKDLKDRDEARWAEEDQTDEGEEDASDMTYDAIEDITESERAISNSAFARCSFSTPKQIVGAMHAQLQRNPEYEDKTFGALRNDTCANRRYII